MTLHNSDLALVKEALRAGGINFNDQRMLNPDNINRTFTNGAAVALNDLLRTLETLSEINDTADGTTTDNTTALLDRLTDTVRSYDDERVFTLFWLTGDTQLIYGPDARTAMNNAGIGAGAISVLDFYAPGDIADQYTWNSEARRWDKVDEEDNIDDTDDI